MSIVTVVSSTDSPGVFPQGPGLKIQRGALPSSGVVLDVIERPPAQAFDIVDVSPTARLQDGPV
jgi:hypothetical protein